VEVEMADILAIVEHRQNGIRDITYELMACGRKLAEQLSGKLTAVLLGHSTEKYVESLRGQAHRLLVVDNEIFGEFNDEAYQDAVAEIFDREKPFLTLIGHTAFGMGLCPALGTRLGIPFTTDALALEVSDGNIRAVRQMYDGKLDARISFRESPSYMVSLRTGSFAAEEGNLETVVENLTLSKLPDPSHIKFIEYIEAAVGDVDITKSDIVIGIGRGIKEKDNIAMVEEFANAMGGVVACTRPVVDAEWLPKDRQVGSSGKTIKPKLYIALGISGAFQHVAGLKGSDTIIAINKDPEAPIFNEADYGIVDDLFKVLPALKDKIVEMK
jgi:electron transfer flavoprotein alpha subunit